MKTMLVLIALALSSAISLAQVHHESRTTLKIPRAIEVEHKDIHRQLESLVDLGGATSAVAQEIKDVLEQHARSEEQYALPVLGILQPLADGTATDDQKNEALLLAGQLRDHMALMLDEHKRLDKKLDRLVAAGLKEAKPLAIEFVDRLRLHIEQEEQILYPAAVLVGDVLKRKPN